MTVVAVAVGPAGVALGWSLSAWGESRRTAAAAREQTRMDDRQRALAILAVASTIVGEGRSLGHAAHQSGTGRSPDKDQVKSSMNRFNTAMADIDRLILEADVLGPDGLSDIGRTLLQHGQDLTQIVTAMQVRLTANDSDKLQQETLPAFEKAISLATADVRALIRPATA